MLPSKSVSDLQINLGRWRMQRKLTPSSALHAILDFNHIAVFDYGLSWEGIVSAFQKIKHPAFEKRENDDTL